MDDQNKNLLLATGLSFLVLIGWMLLFPPETVNTNNSNDTELLEEKSSLKETDSNSIIDTT